MTDIFKVTWNGDHGEESEMHPTGVYAKQAAKALREAGINSLIEKISLRAMGKKDLLCAVYNNKLQSGITIGEDDVGFAEKIETLKEVVGVKKPKDPAAAAALKAKAMANKHRGIKPVNAAIEAFDKSSEGGEPAKKAPVAAKAPNLKKTDTVTKASDTASQTPKAENKGDMTTADLKKSGGLKL